MLSRGCTQKCLRLPCLERKPRRNFSVASPFLSLRIKYPMDVLTDKFGRAITDLRISITDRCNYKCVYCRTGNEGAIYGDLPFADYLRMTRVMVGLGIKKVRITGGEPLLRRGVVDFIRDLAKLQTIHQEPLDIALTTNGHMLAEMAQPLKNAGLTRVTVTMDAVDPDRFARVRAPRP